MYDSFGKLKICRDIERELSEAPVAVALSGCLDSQKVQIAARFSQKVKNTLYICRDDQTAQNIISDLKTFTDKHIYYPSKDFLFYKSDVRSGYIVNLRTDAIRALLSEKGAFVVACGKALLDKIEAPDDMKKSVIRLTKEINVNINKLSEELEKSGYNRTNEVEQTGQYAIRGGLLDVYPFTANNPVRIEFFGDEIDTIRIFDAESQRSLTQTDSVEIFPSEDRNSGKDSSLLDYFTEDDLIYIDEPYKVNAGMEADLEEYRQSSENRALGSSLTIDNETEVKLFSAEFIWETLSHKRIFGFPDENYKDYMPENTKHFKVETYAPGTYKESFKLFIDDLKKFSREKYRITLLSPSITRTKSLAEQLRSYGIKAYCPDENSDELKPGEMEVVYGSLHSGYIYPEIRYVLFTERDVFRAGVKNQDKRRKKYTNGIKISSLSELSVGDYVVHEEHGIGIYRGLEHILRDGVGRDYVKIDYAGTDKLYLPASKLESVQKYAAGDAPKPRLNRLSSPEWHNTKARVNKAVEETARELIKLYAERSRPDGFQCGQDTVWQKEFEEMFPFEETADQISAIEAVKADMESSKIMDRLICGDVGFGKTEVALRAAFKEVQEGRQVAYLVPTTILAEQHYNTFKDRMSAYPVKIEMLSRFRSQSDNKKTVQRLKEGKTDIVIGTHRLLSKDVNFKNLGLLIIDEEQRFGVTHKEKIKKLRAQVDVLTLTATPIPRTLHMSLSGIRDLSLLSEPPLERVAVQTYVMEYMDEFVREAILRETSRGGQVFYVYNRVNDINEKVMKIREMLPDLTVECAHGKMPEKQLEDIMHRFICKEIDVLVSTTIIETGLDIPNANTLIVDGAERMGLSQLYQLRGRVGRSNKTAYAFLMYRKGKILSEEAEKRLKAIREFAQLGAGIKIAMKDLEIRGAGNVLGVEQHGQMEAVGYELYVKLLSKAVRLMKGEPEPAGSLPVSIECAIDAFIPERYIESEKQRLNMYRRISLISSEHECEEITDELIDRFGDIPKETENLLEIAKLKTNASRISVKEIIIQKNAFSISINPDAKLNSLAIPKIIESEHGKLRFVRAGVPRLEYSDSIIHADCKTLLKKTETIIKELQL